MKKEKYDTIGLVMEPYVLDILHALSNPKGFTDLVEYVKNRRTLTLKLNKLILFGLIEHHPIKRGEKYADSYIISKKGKSIVEKLEKI